MSAPRILSACLVLAAPLAVASGARAAQQALAAGPAAHAGFGGPAHAPDAEFIARARAATQRYFEPGAAAADGYRAVGPDFPAMGAHWVHPGLVIAGVFDAEQPQILSYASVAGAVRLVGVAYAIPLAEGESPPAFPNEHAWHVHSGTIEEESLLRTHAGHGEADGFRLAVLHAWIWLENPAGTFATDNWALSYARLGLAPPRDAPLDAARSLSLASGGDAFYLAVLWALVRPDPAQEAAITATIARCRERVLDQLRALEAHDGPNELGAVETAMLATLWAEMWDELERRLGAQLAERVRAARTR